MLDGRRFVGDAGVSILDALRQTGIRVPTLCHDDRVAPAGVCRLCLVNLKDRSRLVPACSTPLEDGMVVETCTPELEAHRRTVLESLARHYPAAAVERCPEKPFHRMLRNAGIAAAAAGEVEDRGRDDSHPYIAVDMSRCIDCYRCVRICDEVQGQRVWHLRNRGLDTRIVADGPTLRDSSCVACGACADTCPTGAIEDADASPSSAAAEWTRTVCPYCGVGCELRVGTRGGRIVSIRPARDAVVNEGHACVKGRYAFAFVHADDRVTEPMIRDGAGWRRVSWAEARSLVAARLRESIDRDGPDSVGLLGSARATNEDNYVVQKFARTVIGTNNVDCCARVCHAPSAVGLKRTLGAGLATNSFDDIERAHAILVCGANPTESHPVVGARIRQAARRGARLVVVDPRRIELAADAVCHLAIRPGTNVALLNALAHVIVFEGLSDRAFLDARVDEFDAFRQFIAAWTPERAAELCGVDADAIRFAARTFASNAPAMTFHGLGLTEQVQGTEGVMALVNLALLTGNIGRPGGGVNPLRGQNNVQGAAHMGCDPATLPGGVAVTDRPGLTLPQMMDAAIAGRFKALWAIGYDILLTNPDANETAKALRSLDFLVVQDLFLTETARQFGSVFLPACSSFEKDGTFMNAERRIQRVRAALRPAGESKPDWQIVAEIACEMGAPGFAFASPEAIWDEVRSVCDGGRGMTYARLDRAGLQWPCPSEAHPGTSILHVDRFGAGARAPLQRIDFTPSPEQTSADYPFTLITGRSLYQFNAGTMTRRTRNAELRPHDRLDVCPADAASLGVRDGDRVQLASRYGRATLPVHISESVQRGQVYATFQTVDAFLNAVTGPNRDAVAGTPEYKVTAVQITPEMQSPPAYTTSSAAPGRDASGRAPDPARA